MPSGATAQSLVSACRAKVGLDTATGCASYDTRTDTFQFDVKIPKATSVGTRQVAVEVRVTDNTIVHTAVTAVAIR